MALRSSIQQVLAYKSLMLSSCEDFTEKMFYFMNNTPYIVGRHHEMIFKALDKVVKGETKKLIINIAPRYGKTLIVSQMFIAYGMALNPESKFLHLSYSDSLVDENSMKVKDIINNEYYQMFFETKIRQGSNTRRKWETIQGGGEYATSTLGQVTGFGAGRVEKEEEDVIDEFTATYNPDMFSGAIVIDDPIKPEDALSETKRKAVNRRFETTIRSRANSRNTPIIVIMQRVHEDDLCGYLLRNEPGDWTVLSIPCIQTDENGAESALWPFKHTLDELYKLKKANPIVFETQYMQNPTPFEGLMYREFRTYSYEQLPNDDKGKNCCYIDSADTGEDYLCAVYYVERPDGNYITDVEFTQEPMEVTEPRIVRKMEKNHTKYCYIESNNGGRIFRRNVERIAREQGNMHIVFIDLTQSENKMVRLFTKADEVCNMCYMPEQWQYMFPDFFSQVTTFRRVGNNKHDDAPDALTGTVEMRGYNNFNAADLLSAML